MFHERQHWQTRLLGMAIVMAGLIMLAIARN
jgi:hypothetical protein